MKQAGQLLLGLCLLVLQRLTECIQCFACISNFDDLESSLNFRLQRQALFFPPASGFDAGCHLPPADRPAPSASLCTTPLCVTLTPHVQGVNFTVRGCAETLLRHAFKERLEAQMSSPDGCSLHEAVDAFGAAFPSPLRLRLCTCSRDFCNGEEQPEWEEPTAGPPLRDQALPEDEGTSTASQSRIGIALFSSMLSVIFFS